MYFLSDPVASRYFKLYVHTSGMITYVQQYNTEYSTQVAEECNYACDGHLTGFSRTNVCKDERGRVSSG